MLLWAPRCLAWHTSKTKQSRNWQDVLYPPNAGAGAGDAGRISGFVQLTIDTADAVLTRVLTSFGRKRGAYRLGGILFQEPAE